jgi:hypothetical protein
MAGSNGALHFFALDGVILVKLPDLEDAGNDMLLFLHLQIDYIQIDLLMSILSWNVWTSSSSFGSPKLHYKLHPSS